jgi:hypothetical protein
MSTVGLGLNYSVIMIQIMDCYWNILARLCYRYIIATGFDVLFTIREVFQYYIFVWLREHIYGQKF